MDWMISIKNILNPTALKIQPMKSQFDAARPFSVMVHKEIADHIRSWRFFILIALIVLTFIAAMYVSLANIKSAISNTKDPDHIFLYLKLLTTTDNSIPPFHVFLSFLAPLLGISLGF